MKRWRAYLLPIAFSLVCASLLLVEPVLLGPLRLLSPSWAGYVQQGLGAVLFMALTWLIARYVRIALLEDLLTSRTGCPTPKLLGDFSNALIFSTGVVAMLANVFGRDVTAILATGGIGLLVVGIALQDMIYSVFAGLSLNLERPFQIGDIVKVDVLGNGIIGTVEEINWRATRLLTKDGHMVVVPNHVIANNAFANYSLPDSTVRCHTRVNIDYQTSVESVERILLAAALATPGVLETPKPCVLAQTLEPSGVVYAVVYWINTYWQFPGVSHELTKNILKQMHAANLKLAYPKSEVLHTHERVGIACQNLDLFHLINQVAAFRDLPQSVRQTLAGRLRQHTFHSGDRIVNMGDNLASLWIVGEGMVEAVADNFSSDRLQSRQYIVTECFGEHALLTGRPYQYLVNAATNVVLYELRKTDLEPLLRDQPELLLPLSTHLTRNDPNPSHSETEFERTRQRLQGQIQAFYGV